jgi:hypothetical protein
LFVVLITFGGLLKPSNLCLAAPRSMTLWSRHFTHTHKE